jgi:hypothetical protein
MKIRTASQFKDELADREAIRDCLYRYCRSVDRLDEDLMRTVYWPDAIDNHLEFTGTVEEFIAWAFPRMRAMDLGQHIIGNVMIRFEGSNNAAVESYFWGVHVIRANGAAFDSIGSGRYLDRFEKRNDEWRVAKRVVVTDWFRNYPDTADWTNGPFNMPTAVRGHRYPKDDSYAKWFGF